MLDYKLIEALAMVVSEGGFEKAGEVMGLSQSAVSQRIMQLESQIGARLVIRDKPIVATSKGRALIAHLEQVKLLERNVNDSTEHENDWLEFSIAVNDDSVSTWFFEAITEFSNQHKVIFNIIIADQAEGLKLLKQNKVIACLSSTNETVKGAVSQHVGVIKYGVFCTDNFQQKYFPHGLNQAALQLAPAITYGPDDSLHDSLLKKLDYNKPYPCHVCPSSQGLINIIKTGMGYGVTPYEQIEPLLSADVVNLAADGSLDENIALYWHYWSGGGDLLKKLSYAILDHFEHRC